MKPEDKDWFKENEGNASREIRKKNCVYTWALEQRSVRDILDFNLILCRLINTLGNQVRCKYAKELKDCCEDNQCPEVVKELKKDTGYHWANDEADTYCSTSIALVNLLLLWPFDRNDRGDCNEYHSICSTLQ